MTAKWIQVYLRHENGTWSITKEPISLIPLDQATILASGYEIALKPCDDKYLMGAPNHFNLEAYQSVDPEELFEIMKSTQILMQCHIDEQKITPITLIGKVIIKWKK
jgi:hypothetical protein